MAKEERDQEGKDRTNVKVMTVQTTARRLPQDSQCTESLQSLSFQSSGCCDQIAQAGVTVPMWTEAKTQGGDSLELHSKTATEP